jgi:hypothetical protein
MEGAALAANRQFDMAIVTAWHTAVFGLTGYAGKLSGKKLSDFLSGAAEQPQRSKSADAIAFFHALRARGVPVEITRH